MLKITLVGEAIFRIFVAALLLSLFARGGGAAELKKLTVGYSTVGPAGIGLWMAKEIGAFDKYGIDAQLIFVSSGPIVVQALLGGDMQAGLAATNAVTAAVLAGAPLVSVMSLINRPYYRCWVQPEITRMEELRGKTLGVSRFGSVTDSLTRILLRRYHLEGAVQIRQMGGTTEMAAAFQRRQIDGAVMATVRVNAPTRMLVDLEYFWVLRDLQADRVFPMNHALLDVLCGLQTWLVRTGVDAPLRVHSGYRTPKTNKLTEGAALDSRHIVGRAVDISVAGISNLKLAGMASVLGHGGTGLYPGRNFVHVDTGDERIWIDRPRK